MKQMEAKIWYAGHQSQFAVLASARLKSDAMFIYMTFYSYLRNRKVLPVSYCTKREGSLIENFRNHSVYWSRTLHESFMAEAKLCDVSEEAIYQRHLWESDIFIRFWQAFQGIVTIIVNTNHQTEALLLWDNIVSVNRWSLETACLGSEYVASLTRRM